MLKPLQHKITKKLTLNLDLRWGQVPMLDIEKNLTYHWHTQRGQVSIIVETANRTISRNQSY